MNREAINVALVSALSNISIANGYALDVTGVHRELRTVDDVDTNEFPALFVEDDGNDQVIYKSGLHVIELPINVIGYVLRIPNEPITTTLNRLDTAVIRAVGADPTLGGACTEALPAGSSYRSGSRAVDYAAFIRPIDIRYKNTLENGL